MKKYIFSYLIISLLFIMVSFGQESFYYYNGEKVKIKINENQFFIELKDNNVDLDKHGLKIIKEGRSSFTDKDNATFWKVVEITKTNENREKIISSLHKENVVLSTSLVIGDSDPVTMSNFFYVKLKDHSDLAILKELAEKTKCQIVKRISEEGLWVKMSTDKYSQGNSLEMSNYYYETGLFSDIDPGFILEYSSSCTNDPSFSSQWALNGTYGINACSAWDLTKGSSNIIVAIVDNGIDTNHPDFANTNFVLSKDCHSSGSQVVYGNHGTLVAGVIAANHNNIGISGIAPGVSIMPVSHNFNMTYLDAYETLANGIDYAWRNGAHVINCSWGVSNSNQTNNRMLEDAITAAITNGRNGWGSIVVFASGNSNSIIEYPANSNTDILCVGATNSSGTRVASSSYGTNLDVVAPGYNILTTTLNNSYEYWNGTSMSAAYVSGVAALILSQVQYTYRANIVKAIESTCTKLSSYSYSNYAHHPNGTWNNQVGHGLINAHKAIMGILNNAGINFSHEAGGMGRILTQCESTRAYLSLAVPSNAQITWTVGSALRITSGQGTSSIWVKVVDYGDNWIQADITHNGETITITRNLSAGFLYQVGYPVYNNYTTTGSMTISTTSDIIGVFTIGAGHTVTVKSAVKCTPSAKIIIKPGGTLVIDGGTLSAMCGGELWNGIEVQGTYSELTQNPTYHGALILKNNAVIANAHLAAYSKYGGIIRATNSTFSNNYNAVYLYNYKRMIDNTEQNNLSYFTNCSFIIDDSNAFNSNGINIGNSYQVRLFGVNGIYFRTCNIKNVMSTITTVRGSGMYVQNAGFHFDVNCPSNCIIIHTNGCGDCTCPTPSVIEGFTCGMYLTYGGSYTGKIDRVNFNDNIVSISCQSTNNLTVTRSNFNLSDKYISTANATREAISLSNSSGYKIEGNTFTDNTNRKVYTGIHVMSSGTAENIIYRNNFSNLWYGIRYWGNNGELESPISGLQFQCNIFNNNSNDIDTYNSSSTLRIEHGDLLTSAENIFSIGASRNFYSSNNNQYIDYMMHRSGGGAAAPRSISNNIFIMPYSRNVNTCPDKICTGSGGTGIISKSTNQNDDLSLYNSLKEKKESIEYEFSNMKYNEILKNYDPSDQDKTAAVEYSNALNLKNEISSLSFEMAEISDNNIKLILNGEETNHKELRNWLEIVHTPAAKYTLVENYWEAKEYSKAGSLLEEIPYIFEFSSEDLNKNLNYIEFNNFRTRIALSKRDYAELTKDEKDELIQIADKREGPGSDLAQQVLCFFYDICYTNEFPESNIVYINNKENINIKNSDIYIYPNPTEGNVTIESYTYLINDIKISDLTGKVIKQFSQIKSNSKDISIEDLNKGTYIITVETEKGSISDRLIKK